MLFNDSGKGKQMEKGKGKEKEFGGVPGSGPAVNSSTSSRVTLFTQLYLNIRIWPSSMLFYDSGKGNERKGNGTGMEREWKGDFEHPTVLKYSKSALFHAFQ